MMNSLILRIAGAAAALVMGTSAAGAGKPTILNARILKIGTNAYEFQVTVAHDDESWEHYLDRWEVVGPGGKVVGTRVLFHPHIGEPHFTRTLRPVTIPDGTKHVIIRVHDKVHGYGREKLVNMPTETDRDTGWQ